jgi:lipoprotein-releasing system ATP-binding protein
MSQLRATNLVKQFPTRGEPLAVLRGVDLELNSGENLGVLGPSGSGKSTLLHILGTLDAPTSGEYLLDDAQPFTFNETELAEFRNRRIGFVFQDHHLLPQCSVLENVLLPTIAGSRATDADVERARGLIECVGLTGRIDHRPAELSGGEKQRVAVARALLMRPALLLADEPTGNLDRSAAESITALLLDLQKQEQTMMIVVTHSLELAARLDRRCSIDDGQLIPE